MKQTKAFNSRACLCGMIGLGLVLAAAGRTAVAQAPTGYTAVDLGAFQPTGGINDAGDVVGYTLAFPYHAMLWSQGVLTDLGTLGGSTAVPFGINNAGQISGVLSGQSGLEHFVYDHGAVTLLGTHPAAYYPTRINNLGEVAGTDGAAVFRGFWYHGGAIEFLSTPGCDSASATALNDTGLVVGAAGGGVCGLQSAVAWASGAFQILPVPSGTTGATAYAVNSVGQIAGFAYTPDPHAISWQPDGVGGYSYSVLGPGPDETASSAFSVNNANVIVGALDTASSGERGFVWDSANGMSDLNTLIPMGSGMVLGAAWGVSNSGSVVGEWHANDGTHTYLLSPTTGTTATPGPTTFWLGLKNSDDVGTKFDVLAETLENGAVVASSEIDSVPGGSSGFNNAVQRVIAFATPPALAVGPGDTLAIRLSARISATGHRSGTARLWYNDSAANSRWDVSLNGVVTTLYLRGSFLLNQAPGSGPKQTADVFADRAVNGNPFKPFGTWSITF